MDQDPGQRGDCVKWIRIHGNVVTVKWIRMQGSVVTV